MNQTPAKKENQSEIVIYTGEDGEPQVQVRIEGENIWLSQRDMSKLFNVEVNTVNYHLKEIFEDGELSENSVIRNYRITAQDGKEYDTKHYSLETIIAVGYRVRSSEGTRFRQWATERISEYMIKGFAIDENRLKGSGGGDYWRELLDKIRDIRSSEKALYRQVLDLYATSIDYDPIQEESIQFFKVVQNKLHYAANEHTAAETIHERANAESDFMGLTTFKGDLPVLDEVRIAKNYLTHEELQRLNLMVSAFFDLAELRASEKQEMRMSDWVKELDKFAENYGKGVLKDAGKISAKEARSKAVAEYKKFKIKTLSPVEEAYIKELKSVQKMVEKENKD